MGRSCVEVWGSGAPRREFIFSHDLADACVFLMDRYERAEPVNLGVGYDYSIREIAEAIRAVVGYSGELKFDLSKPDGMPAKLLESTCLKEMGWRPRTPIDQALALTYEWFLKHEAAVGDKEHGRKIV
jgi:GDP-L-fucose synthase